MFGGREKVNAVGFMRNEPTKCLRINNSMK